MAVAFADFNNATPTTASSIADTLTVAGTNPAILVTVAAASNTATISSVTWSLGGGTPVEVKNARATSASTPNAFISQWVVPSPTAGSGTVTANASASVPLQMSIQLFTGAGATTPCPVSDAVSSTTAASSTTLTPTNLTANNATCGGGANTVADDPNGVTPTNVYSNGTTSVNLETGYATGTGGITMAWIGAAGNHACVAARIVEFGADSGPSGSILTFGTKPLNGGMRDMTGGMV